uniref:COP1-interacting protein 7 n=2 Tax=Kalanchoe fedtschenkoi TaxID=63787 RepID=A0A7N0US26_KALFE
MAFARALAAGFNFDHMSPLISFAECFGASRFMDACTRFIHIWKTKHYIGQWLETEGADAASGHLGYATMMGSGFMLSSVAGKEMNFAETWPESATEPGQLDNLKHNTESISDTNNNSSQQAHEVSQNHVHGQFYHPIYLPWGMHSPPGTLPVLQAYPSEGIPYYKSYSGLGPFIYPPYQSPEDVEYGPHKKRIQRRHSTETNGVSKESENREIDEADNKSLSDSDLEKEASDSSGLCKKTRSSKKNSGTVIIRNINYITAKKQNASGSESSSKTDDECDKNAGGTSGTKSVARQRTCSQSFKLENSMNGQLDQKVSSSVHWHAFQNCLLRSAEESGDADQAMFSMEKEAKIKPCSIPVSNDALTDRAWYQTANGGAAPFCDSNGDTRIMQKRSNDELLKTRFGNDGDQGIYKDGSIDILEAERDGSGLRYKTANDDFTIRRPQNQSNYAGPSADLFSASTYTDVTQNIADDSFILPSRPAAPLEDGTIKRDAIYMNYELPSTLSKTENCRIRSQETYEPEDLAWIAERGTGQGLRGYNPSLDYEMEVNINKSAPKNARVKNAISNTKIEPTKNDNIRKVKVASGALDNKRTMGLMKRGKPNKKSPIEEARARAEKLRSFKEDMQKQKKERDEEQKKRIEDLKLERQKRIAARSNVAPKSVLPSPQTRKQLLSKPSSLSLKGSKFSDSEPGFSSPLQGVSRRTLSLGAKDTPKASKPKSKDVTPSSGNKVTRSLTSPSELKTGEGMFTPEHKLSMARIRRLSEPRRGTNHVSSAKLLSGTPPVAKANTSAGSERKKISAIMKLDKTKADTLPELKIRVPDSDACTDVSFEKSAVEPLTKNGNHSIPAHTFANAGVETNNSVVQQNDGDENPVEKNVVIFEHEKPSIVDEHAANEVTGSQTYDHHSGRLVTDISRDPRSNQLRVRFDSHEVRKSTAEKDVSKSSVVEASLPCRVPYARVSLLEDPCAGNSEYGKGPPTISNKGTSSTVEATEAPPAFKLSQRNLESVPEVLGKPQVKEPSKGGFKRLLKFGKKNLLSSGDDIADADSPTHTSSQANHYAANDASSSQAPILKNLMSHDETNTMSTPPLKSSRHFSLLSPFRKSAEKKIVIL